ncbi:MAG: glutaminase [Actinomycetota bacterium]|nr:glutaminase [Actinomycetota bacterium]
MPRLPAYREQVNDLDAILRDAVARLAGVQDDALGELRIRRFRPPKIVPIGRAWRLGSVLLSADGTMYRAGRTTRAVEPKQFLANKSNEAAERRELQLAAVRGGFSEGETVHFGVTRLEPELVDGVWMIAWSGAVGAGVVPLAAWLDERVRLLEIDRA